MRNLNYNNTNDKTTKMNNVILIESFTIFRSTS